MLTNAEIEAYLNRVQYKDWRLELHETEWEGPFLRILIEDDDNFTPGEKITLGINSIFPPFRSEEDLSLWLMKRIIRIESHEARERFLLDGEIVFSPHAEGEPYDVVLGNVAQ